MADVEALKRHAGIEACKFVKSGMKVGLGTGSTVKHTVIELGRMISEEGLEIVGVPTSLVTEKLAIEENSTELKFSKLDELLDSNILKIEKKLNSFIKDIYIILDSKKFHSIKLSIKKILNVSRCITRPTMGR